MRKQHRTQKFLVLLAIAFFSMASFMALIKISEVKAQTPGIIGSDRLDNYDDYTNDFSTFNMYSMNGTYNIPSSNGYFYNMSVGLKYVTAQNTYAMKGAIYFASNKSFLASTSELIFQPTSSWQWYNLTVDSYAPAISGTEYILAVWTNSTDTYLILAGWQPETTNDWIFYKGVTYSETWPSTIDTMQELPVTVGVYTPPITQKLVQLLHQCQHRHLHPHLLQLQYRHLTLTYTPKRVLVGN